MNFDDFKDPKREHDGGICIADECVSVRGANYDCLGECCAECDCLFPPEQVTRENEDIAFIRLKYKFSKVE